jgi:hypothetical protein
MFSRARLLLPKISKHVLKRPNSMCWGCGSLMYRDKLSPIDVADPSLSPAIAAFPDHAGRVRIVRADGNRVHSHSVWVCTPCKTLNDSSGGSLSTVRLFLNVGDRPACIKALQKNEPYQLALVRLKACTFRKQGTPSFPFFRGSVRSEPANYEGLLGCFYDVVDHAVDSERDVDSRDRVVAAVKWLRQNNSLFESSLSLAETLHDYIRTNDTQTTTTTSFQTNLSAFVTFDDSELQLKLAEVRENKRQGNVGNELKGLLMSIEDWPEETHEPQLKFNRLVAGCQFSRDATSFKRKMQDKSVKVVSFGDRDLEAKIFPDLYPYGTGSYHLDVFHQYKKTCMTPAHYFRARLRCVDHRWRRSYFWPFFQFDQMEKSRIHAAQAAIVRENEPSFSGRKPNAGMVRDSKRLNAETKQSDQKEQKEAKRDQKEEQIDVDDLRSGFLPSSIAGGTSYWQKRMRNLATMVQRLGCPDLFITLTANEWHWPELAYLRDNHIAVTHRPFDCVTAFMRRWQQTLQLITSGKLFGEITDHWYRLEYQNRGSPHVHFVVWLKDKRNMCQHVSARVPQPPNGLVTDEQKEIFRKLVEYVQLYQTHTCNKFCTAKTRRNAKAMADHDASDNKETQDSKDSKGQQQDITMESVHSCKDSFPIPLSEHCQIDTKSGRVTYRRVIPADQWIIPYNPLLLLLWQGKTNVQVCTTARIIRYLVKYLTKTEPIFSAEIIDPKKKAYLSSEAGKHIYGRLVGAPEVIMRLLSYSHAKGSRQVLFLDTEMDGFRHRRVKSRWELRQLADEDEDVFYPGALESYVARPDDNEFKSLTYPQYFIRYELLSKNQKVAAERQIWYDANGRRVVKRNIELMHRVHFKTPHEHGERFYYQQLLLNVSFRNLDELLSESNATRTYKEECFTRNVMRDKSEIEWLNQLAVERHFSPQFIKKIQAAYKAKQTSANVNVDAELPDILGDIPAVDQVPTIAPNTVEQAVTDDLEAAADVADILGLRALYKETERKYSNVRLISEMTNCQRKGHFTIMSHLAQHPSGLFFLTGAGGTGKSDLIMKLCNDLQDQGKSVGVTAISGAAATLLKGQTFHSFLGLRIDLTFSNALNTNRQYRLQRLDVLIIDEVSMMSKRMLQAAHDCLSAVRKDKRKFGGVTMLLVGDFYQLPPVLDKPSSFGFELFAEGKDSLSMLNDAEVYEHPWWSDFIPIVLTENCRQSTDPDYADMLSRIRVGDPIRMEHSISLNVRTDPFDETVRQALRLKIPILAARNDVVDLINEQALNNNTHDAVTFDAVDVDGSGQPVTDESTLQFLNSATGLRKTITLKVGCTVMVRRNIDIETSIVNGTIGRVKLIEQTKKLVIIERLGPLSEADNSPICIYPKPHHVLAADGSQFVRTALPLSVAHAQTIHKSQGQTMASVVVVLDDIKCSGQLYTALSRVKTLTGLRLTWHKATNRRIAPVVSDSAASAMRRCLRLSQQLPSPPSTYDGTIRFADRMRPSTTTSQMFRSSFNPKDALALDPNPRLEEAAADDVWVDPVIIHASWDRPSDPNLSRRQLQRSGWTRPQVDEKAQEAWIDSVLAEALPFTASVTEAKYSSQIDSLFPRWYNRESDQWMESRDQANQAIRVALQDRKSQSQLSRPTMTSASTASSSSTLSSMISSTSSASTATRPLMALSGSDTFMGYDSGFGISAGQDASTPSTSSSSSISSASSSTSLFAQLSLM